MRKIVLVVTVESTAMTAYRGYLRFLRDNAWDVAVIAKSEGALESWASDEGAIAHSIDFRREPSPFHDIKALLAMYKLFRKLRPDVVVSATPKAGLIGTLAAKVAGVPTRIYQLWGLRLETEYGWKRRLLTLLERVTVKASTQCVANSYSLASVAEDLGIAPIGEIKVLGSGSSHGVSLERFSRSTVTSVEPTVEQFLGEARTLSIIYVGRITRDKGIGGLVEAVHEVYKSGIDVHLLLLGRIEDIQLADDLASAPDYIQVQARVEDVAPYIAAADVLCLPTLREGFPNVVLEAAALEVPSIVSNATGAIDSVVDGETGWIFPVGNTSALASIIKEISVHRDELKRRGLRARVRVEEQYEQSHVWRLQVENIQMQVTNNRINFDKGV